MLNPTGLTRTRRLFVMDLVDTYTANCLSSK